MYLHLYYSSFFFLNDTATTEIYTLSLHDALPISLGIVFRKKPERILEPTADPTHSDWLPGASLNIAERDRKSTRLNSSHDQISYAVFCLKKKKYNDYVHFNLCI